MRNSKSSFKSVTLSHAALLKFKFRLTSYSIANYVLVVVLLLVAFHIRVGVIPVSFHVLENSATGSRNRGNH